MKPSTFYIHPLLAFLSLLQPDSRGLYITHCLPACVVTSVLILSFFCLMTAQFWSSPLWFFSPPLYIFLIVPLSPSTSPLACRKRGIWAAVLWVIPLSPPFSFQKLANVLFFLVPRFSNNHQDLFSIFLGPRRWNDAFSSCWHRQKDRLWIDSQTERQKGASHTFSQQRQESAFKCLILSVFLLLLVVLLIWLQKA